MKKFFVTLTLLVFGGLLFAACGGGDSSNNASNQTGSNKTAGTGGSTTSTPASTSSTPASTTTASGEKIGVPECDDYIAKYEACLSSKVPAEGRAQWNSALEQARTSWRQLAANPQTRASLANACKMATDMAKQNMSQYGCDF